MFLQWGACNLLYPIAYERCMSEVSITNSILVIVDLQNGFINSKTRQVIKKIETAKKRLEYSTCIFTKFSNSDTTAFSRFLHWNRLVTPDEQRIAIPISETDIIVDKTTYSASVHDLKKLIDIQNVDNAYICGVDTDGCVLATAFALFDLGIKPSIIIDACASNGGMEYHRAAELIMRRSFGKEQVLELCEYLGGHK